MCNFINIDSETIIAICALIVSVVSIIISVRTLKIQRTHNEKSVKPLGQIILNDYENQITVDIRNVGIGPMILKELSVTNLKGETKDNLIDFIDLEMPDGLTWNDYVKQVKDRVIAVGEGIVLIGIDFESIESPTKDSMNQLDRFRDGLRRTLGDIVVKIRYTGIYENEIQTTERKLDWFKRHFE